jgi:hypothetical protein
VRLTPEDARAAAASTYDAAADLYDDPANSFRVGDMLALDIPPSSFDAVVCVFGI